ncbi:hypothetical protein Theos_2237 (plasmid) [Thermus oshimai JL-2]|uniref:Uncharacterized protein n=1 Tax=Thermus oshimai JL-2 TaxID=751945 RepID=K7QYU0_THEOS|nr:hypothetical protein [Thermus oshimai]AFV77228.1 hypothetical protein Theos_2237 [Thermus oshimai JL-2]
MEEKGEVREQKPRPKLLWPRSGRDWLLAGLLAFLVLGIVGNLLPEEPGEVQVGAVRLKVPEGFEVRDVEGGKALLAPKEGPKDSFRENLTVLKEALPQAVNSFQYAQVVAWRNGQGLEAFQVGGVRPVQVLGVPGVAFAAQGTHQGKTLEFQVVAFVLGGEGYQITLTGEPGKLAQYAGPFQEALAPLGLAQAAQAPSPQGGAPLPQSPAPGPLPTPAPLPYAAPGPTPDPYGGEPALPYDTPALPYDADPSGDLGLPDTGDGGFWDSWKQGEEFNTWMSEEWSQALSGETPDITHFDEQGNPYWEGPSGTLHEWDWGGWDLGGSGGDVP